MSFLTKFKALPEDARAQAKARAASDPEFAQKLKTEISSLSAADRQELRALMTGTPIDLSKVPKGQVDNAVEQEVRLENESFNKESRTVFENVTDTMGKMGQGVIDTVVGIGSSIPFGDTISANVNAAVEEGVARISGTDDKTFEQRVNQNKQLYNEGVLGAQERSPVLTGVGQLAGNIAQVGVPAAKAATAVGKVAQAMGYAEKAVKASQLAAVTSTDFIVGALQIEATKGEHGVESFADSMLKSGMYTAFGAGLGVTVSKGVPVLAKWASNGALKTLQASRGSQKLFNEVKKFTSQSKFADSADAMIDEDTYIKVLNDIPGYNDLIKAGDAFGAGKLVKAAHGRLNQTKSSLFNALDTAGIKANKQAVIDTLESMRDSLAEGIQEGAIQINTARRNYLLETIDTLKQFPEEQISLQRVDGLLDKLQYVGDKLPDVGSELLGRLRNNINGVVKNAAESSDEALSNLAKQYQDTNKALRVTYHNSDVSFKLASELNDLSSKGVIGQVMSDVVSSLSSIKGLAGATLSGGYSVLHAAGKSSGALRTLIKGVEGAEYGIQKLNEVTSFFTTGSGRHSKTGQTLISGLGRTVLENPSTEELTQKIEDLHNASLLLQKPMDRTSASFVAKKDALIPLVTSLAPEIGEQLSSIVKNGEEIGPFMEQIANHPAAREIFTPGQGWDGKTYDPAVKKSIVSQIDLLPASVGSGPLKKKIKEDLMLGGIIPDLNSLPKRQPRNQ